EYPTSSEARPHSSYLDPRLLIRTRSASHAERSRSFSRYGPAGDLHATLKGSSTRPSPATSTSLLTPLRSGTSALRGCTPCACASRIQTLPRSRPSVSSASALEPWRLASSAPRPGPRGVAEPFRSGDRRGRQPTPVKPGRGCGNHAAAPSEGAHLTIRDAAG